MPGNRKPFGFLYSHTDPGAERMRILGRIMPENVTCIIITWQAVYDYIGQMIILVEDWLREHATVLIILAN